MMNKLVSSQSSALLSVQSFQFSSSEDTKTLGDVRPQDPGHQGVSAGCCCSWSEPQDWALLAPSAQPSVVCVGRVPVIPLTSSILTPLVVSHSVQYQLLVVPIH